VVVPAGNAGEAAHRAVQLVTDSIPRALGIDVAEIQVVVPARRGRSGTAALNAALKARLNPGPGEFAGFDVGDRITARGFRTQAGLTLGEAGIVVDKIADGLVLRVGDRQVTVERPAEVLEHGWAITVRQAQGSRWPAVVAVLSGEAAGMLSRPLVYTAVTRAQRHLSVVAAAGAALSRAVAAVPERSRCTRLEGLLRQEG
jgi:exodeoxyribonuclease V alpha subunit